MPIAVATLCCVSRFRVRAHTRRSASVEGPMPATVSGLVNGVPLTNNGMPVTVTAMKTRAAIRNKALGEAVRRAGGQTRLAQLLGVRQSTVREWLVVNGKPAPEHCPDIERHTGVQCEQLRPDVFGRLSKFRAQQGRAA